MSGPKLSEAEIARLEQERLERERQEALKKLMEARSQYQTVVNSIQEYKKSVLVILESLDVAYRSDIEQKIKNLLTGLNCKTISSSNPDIYLEEIQQLKSELDSAKREIDAELGTIQRKITNDKDFSKRITDIKVFSLNDNNPDKEIESITIDFSCHYDDLQIQRILKDISDYLKSKMLSNQIPEMAAFYKDALKTIHKLSDGHMKTDDVLSLVQKIINEEGDQIRQVNEFNSLFDMYLALALVLSIDPKDKNEFSIEEIKQEIEELQNQYKRLDEMDFIADQINSVMIEQGYTFVSSRVLKKKDSGETDFSLYQDKDNSGIAVYTDDTGAIMMRTTILGDGEDITDDDREKSYQSQIDFCSRHPELIDALAQRGVYLKQISYKAPDKEHTYKINVSDSSDKSVTSSKTPKSQSIDRRSRRRNGNKKMRSV